MHLAQPGIVIPLSNGSVAMVPVMADQGTLDNQHAAWQVDQQMHRQPLGPLRGVLGRKAFWASLPTETGKTVIDVAIPHRFSLTAHNPYVFGQ